MQEPALFCSLHSALAPHGDGTHGVGRSCSTAATSILQRKNGSPVYPISQMHIGVWLTTLHSAFNPHEPEHGFRHFLLIQARFVAQSVLLVHSGRQFGGDPINSARHLQSALSPFSVHCELGPHGDGWQGLTFNGGDCAKIKKKINKTDE